MSDMTSSDFVARTVREDVQAMHAYQVPDARGMIKLDAMENPFGLPQALQSALAQGLAGVLLNRYPIPRPQVLLDAIRQAEGVPEGCDIALGNGSDELIHLILQVCAKPGAVAMAPVPSFVMYEVSAKLNGMVFVGVPLNPDFSLDVPAFVSAITQHQPAVVFLAYPNNPTGNLFDVGATDAIVRAAPGLVVIDEAYFPFAQASWAEQIASYPNVVVLRTFSKLGLAGIRLGYLMGPAAWIAPIERVRPPYNINVLTQFVGEFACQHIAVFHEQAAVLREERARVHDVLIGMPACEVFASRANFLLVRMPNPVAVFTHLRDAGVLVKNLASAHPLLQGCLRVTIGSPEENDRFIAVFSQALTRFPCR